MFKTVRIGPESERKILLDLAEAFFPEARVKAQKEYYQSYSVCQSKNLMDETHNSLELRSE